MAEGEGRQVGKIGKEDIFCPFCGNSRIYLLGDGRRSCGACRKKFTPGPRKQRLPEDLHQDIIREFWQMSTAEHGANILGLNRKTMQRHYSALRSLMAEENRRALEKWLKEMSQREAGEPIPPERGFCPCIPDNLKVFCMVADRQRIFVLFPNEVRLMERCSIPGHLPCASIYAGSPASRRGLVLDDFHQQIPRSGSLVNKEGPGMLGHFWIFSKYRLKRYRGGVKRNFELFIREMEFRFNCQTEGKGCEWLVELHQGGTIT